MDPIIHNKSSAAAALSLSVSTFEKLVRLKQAPAPRRISDGRVGWLHRELVEHAETLPVSDLPPPSNAGRRLPTIPQPKRDGER